MCALQQDWWHIIFNSLQGACESITEWKEFEKHTKTLTKPTAEPFYKDALLTNVIPKTDRASRVKAHARQRDKIDWRWETLEGAVERLAEVYAVLVSCKAAIAAALKGEGTFVVLVLLALACPWLCPLLVWMTMLAKRVGYHARWFEGCPCCGKLKEGFKTWAQRRAARLKEDGPGHCFWQGKKMVPIVFG